MFLFPWFDWGDDISDFEKIDFLGHERFLGVPSSWAGWFCAAATLTQGSTVTVTVCSKTQFFRFSVTVTVFEE